MKNLHITIKDRIATYQARCGDIVCGNSDYQIVFNFDSDWNGVTTKTARFVWNGKHYDQTFTGNTCPVPIISNADSVEVGVYAGDLRTTTPATIRCVRSILCQSGTPHPGGNAAGEQLSHTLPVLVLNGANASDFSNLELYFIVRVYRESGSRYSGHQKLNIEPMSVSGETKAVFNTVHFFRDGTSKIDREQLRICNLMSNHSVRIFIQYNNGDTGAVDIDCGVSKNMYLTKDMDYVVVESY